MVSCLLNEFFCLNWFRNPNENFMKHLEFKGKVLNIFSISASRFQIQLIQSLKWVQNWFCWLDWLLPSGTSKTLVSSMLVQHFQDFVPEVLIQCFMIKNDLSSWTCVWSTCWPLTRRHFYSLQTAGCAASCLSRKAGSDPVPTRTGPSGCRWRLHAGRRGRGGGRAKETASEQ